MNQPNPFIQHALRHGRELMEESNRAVATSNALISSLDETIMAISSGNIQGALNAAGTARNMAGQVAEAAQQVNITLNERMEMASFVLTRIQSRVNELASAFQTMMITEPSVRPEMGHYTTHAYQQTFSPLV